MSAGVLRNPALLTSVVQSADRAEAIPPGQAWDPATFAREQIRSLVRAVFFSNPARAVRQVVITAADCGIDVTGISQQLGISLSQETAGKVAVLCHGLCNNNQHTEKQPKLGKTVSSAESLLIDQRIRTNLWFIPADRIGASSELTFAGASLESKLWELRRDFQYSVIEGPPANEFSTAAAAAQLSDGVILVLWAHRTRRAMAKQIVAQLQRAHAHILGAILAGRTFPIPESIYRRL